MDENDPRNTLIIKAVDMILDTNVDNFLIENVPQALRTYIQVN
jgi:site-specific DNA-cytosine methylase